MVSVEKGQEEDQGSLAGDPEGAVRQEASLLPPRTPVPWPVAAGPSCLCTEPRCILSSCDSGRAPCQAQRLNMSAGLLLPFSALVPSSQPSLWN